MIGIYINILITMDIITYALFRGNPISISVSTSEDILAGV